VLLLLDLEVLLKVEEGKVLLKEEEEDEEVVVLWKKNEKILES
jgi:hypothetical protein